MQSITVEVRDAGERLQELTDAVLQGQDVWITYYGEPVAHASLQHVTGEGPPPGLRIAVLALLDGAVRHLRNRYRVNPWCLN
jgi:hypothetical protein